MTGPDDIVTAGAAIAAATARLDQGHPDGEGSVSTGHCDLDDLLAGGLWPGQLLVVAASTGVGRSMFLLNLARAAAMRGASAFYASPQHDRHEVALRLLATECRVPLNHLRARLLTPEDRAKIDRHRAGLAALPLRIDTSPVLRPDEVLSHVERFAPRPRVVVLDAIPDLASPAGVRSLAQLARTRRTAVVVSVSLPDTGRPPALRGVPAALAEAADVVLGLDREAMRDPESLRPGEADVHVLKSRHSPTPSPIAVAFQGHYARFVDLAP